VSKNLECRDGVVVGADYHGRTFFG
jgi:hypothetical protein